MTLTELVAGMTPDERRGALLALDPCSQPMTVRQIERALREAGHSRPWSAAAASTLKALNIIALHGDIK
jgi:hypothetical protein